MSVERDLELLLADEQKRILIKVVQVMYRFIDEIAPGKATAEAFDNVGRLGSLYDALKDSFQEELTESFGLTPYVQAEEEKEDNDDGK